MASVGITNAKKRLNELVKASGDEPVVILVNNHPSAVLLGVDEYRALRSLARLADRPGELDETLTAYREAAAGDDSGSARLDPDATLDEALAAAAAAAAPEDRMRVGELADMTVLLERLSTDAQQVLSSLDAIKPR